MFCLTLFFFFLTSILLAQEVSVKRTLKWEPFQTTGTGNTDSVTLLYFKGAENFMAGYNRLPVFYERFRISTSNDSIGIKLKNEVYIPITPAELKAIKDDGIIGQDIRITGHITIEDKKPFLAITFLPLRKNPVNSRIEKLASFEIAYRLIHHDPSLKLKSGRVYADHSVLSQGTWFRFSLTNTGLYKLSYNDIKSMGADMASVNPHNIRVFGNGGGMLPEANAVPRIDDLREISIYVNNEESGQFTASDYILFYGEAPDKWSFDSLNQIFHHKKNLYSDNTFYFLTYDNGPGKRIGVESSLVQEPHQVINTFNDYAFYEKDDLNLIRSGREWYDQEFFDITLSRNYSFNFTNLDTSRFVTLKADMAARSTTGTSNFVFEANGKFLMTITIGPTTSDYLDNYALKGSKTGVFKSSRDLIDMKITYNKNQSPDLGWLNNLEINAIRHLTMNGSQMNFRSGSSLNGGQVCEYRLSASASNLGILDVTDPSNIRRVQASQNGGTYSYQLKGDTLREFLAFDGNSFFSVSSPKRIDNQDLHGTASYDYIMITPPDFMSEAQRLAQFHTEHDGYSVLVTTPDIIYNEFSSGAQDISAIRDFVKMMYDKAPAGKGPKYLLLFGDGSYDYKNRVANNTNFIPTYESAESLSPVDTYVTDDFLGLLDDNEGQSASGSLDIGIGRFPADNIDDAKAAVDKILYYTAQSDTVKNDWRNIICFTADDGDSNLHLGQAEDITSMITSQYPEFNVDKIYLDAYTRISTPGGARNPDVNDAINKRIGKGALIMSYVGHGGTLGWSHERVLEIPDIKNWDNYTNMPAFVTATCEFSQFDDPSFVSAGELVFLNQHGGGIALCTTTRPTFAGSNFELTTNFYEHAFNKTNSLYPTMGELIRVAKNSSSPGANTLKFVLLGDPGLRLAYPHNDVVTTSFNGVPASSTPDTIKALSSVTISGEIRDDSGNRLTGFNGSVFPTVYDKASVVSTLGTNGSLITQFSLRKNIIYKGKVDVKNGEFTFTFLCPKDISYVYGNGKISYYARSNDSDANGYDGNVIVGGFNSGASVDNTGPVIRLYMNDQNFVSGGITNQEPHLLAFVSDESGINTVGNGIGHDITAVLDENTKDALILNDYYVSDDNTYKSGVINYPMTGLTDGEHSITLKIWDVYNNSSVARIDFLVVSTASFAFRNLKNFPNPFRDKTTFSFEYNQPFINLDVDLRIYSLFGALVRTIHKTIMTEGFKAEVITWDGTSNDGAMVGSGTYIYRVQVSLPDGGSVAHSSKLVFIR